MSNIYYFKNKMKCCLIQIYFNEERFHFIYLFFPYPAVLAFDGHFHVLRGDVFTTGLKYNHTSAFRQKRAYYEKLIETALQDKGGMSVTKCEIDSFGSGPLVQVKFRVLLDMKSMPM